MLAARRARDRGSAQALDEQAERAGADDVGVRHELRRRDGDAGDALVLHPLRGGDLVQLLPDHVARRQDRTLLRQRVGNARRALLDVDVRERVGEAGQTLRPQLDRVDEVLVDRAQRAGRSNLLRLRVRLLLLLCVPLEARLEVGLLQPRRHEVLGELVAEGLVALRERRDLPGIRLVLRLLALPLAGADPEDEPDDDDDRDRDQADEAGERDEAGRRAQRLARRALAPAAASGPFEPWQATPLRRLDGLGLVEEVEFDVVVVGGVHAVRLSGQTVLRRSTREEMTLPPPNE